MSDDKDSYRRILSSSSIIGGASLINVALGLVRMKAAALILGPAGVGLIGLLQNLVATGSAIAAMGVGGAGSRQIAAGRAQRGAEGEAAARRAMFWATLVLGLFGGAATWAARMPIARHVLGDETLANSVGWLAVGVALSVAAGAQIALLIGLRRVGDVARVNILSGLATTLIAIAAIAWLGSAGILLFVIALPLAGFLAGAWFALRLPRPSAATSLAALTAEWRVLATLGFAIMLGGVIGSGGQLIVRGMIKEELGLGQLGLFQAAWMISMTYLGFVLSAMGADYSPRLSAAIGDRAAANRIVNEQTEVALLLGGPVLLVILGGGRWILELIYASEFRDAAQILRWQILGDLLKILSWPVAFVLLAARDGRAYVACELLAMATFVALTWLLLPLAGVEASGFAFLGMYLVYFPAVFWMARRKIGLRFDRLIVRQFALLAVAAGAIIAVSTASPLGALALSLLVAAVMLAIAADRLEQALPARLAAPIAAARRRIIALGGRAP